MTEDYDWCDMEMYGLQRKTQNLNIFIRLTKNFNLVQIQTKICEYKLTKK